MLRRTDVLSARFLRFTALCHMIRRPGAPLAERLWLSLRRIPRRLVLELGVELRSKEEDVGGKVEPGHKEHDRRQGTVGLVVVPKATDVETEAERQQQPDDGSEDRA